MAMAGTRRRRMGFCAIVEPQRRVAVLLLATLLLLVALNACHIHVAEAVSDRTLKRRAQRVATEGEKLLEHAAEAQEEMEMAQQNNTAGATYNRAINEFVPGDGTVKLGTNPIAKIRRVIPITYHQCVFHAQRWLTVHPDETGTRLGGTFKTTDDHAIKKNPFLSMMYENPYRSPNSSFAGTAAAPAGVAPPAGPCGVAHRNCSATKNPCGLHHVPYDELFSGIDKVILVGDSTILRDYKFLEGARDSSYRQKVADLPNPHIMFRKVLSSGRSIEVHFFRLLYVAMLESQMEHAFKIATSNSLMLMSLGPHDTSWLIFDRTTFNSMRVMPTMVLAKEADRRTGKKYHQSQVLRNNLMRAKVYWLRWVAHATEVIGRELRNFEERERAKGVVGSVLRPFVVFREQLMPKCSDPKYANNPHTRCVAMLKPVVVPFMREYLRAQMLLINVPIVGMDALTARVGMPCYLVDAGHLPRACKTVELQLATYAFRLGRRMQVVQGFPLANKNTRATGDGDAAPYGEPPVAQQLMHADGIEWSHLARRVTHLRPRGVTHPNEAVRANPNYHFDGLVIPAAAAYSEAEWRLFERFDDPRLVERMVGSSGGQRGALTANQTQPPSDKGDDGQATSDGATDDGERLQTNRSSRNEDALEGDAPSEDKANKEGAPQTLQAIETGDSKELTRSEMRAALNSVTGDTKFDDLDEILGASTYRKLPPSASRVGIIPILSFLALTVVSVLLWRSVGGSGDAA